ncbi:MFS transporter [Tuwongella immobilis]|uniref:Major facilitator superfamily (MFS) profile domain-containing protein n=1 Tax=Tuwongella immobilis TaxID=692036 RepID=A0A6C2YME9_9BACT|nr:MFS transporter [Tuwongella immobilis]VIP02770.1 mfs transporter : Major facilitator superfamily MFS_1 OS=Planctomyces limnophilus (strain ATCC 43296 / DSM 3776 / IFAM 1008 / 290) GN=Plim_3330 PE=4 SV=1: MFS_1 [Tuwongella immobilis]VTS02399.1 mfs transporter : Major facilitator superfamily MFS_1 OS=Planctomyces limnophilus (strain ATCC 43296 / DSM 3776 / IFAM 1008 / 290) GN=Plim_3330 PE=4 SV=1: MFS_1 [Tuwongella immobilis]
MASDSTPSVPPAAPLTVTQWLIVVIAAIGFLFDIYELLMLPLVLPQALLEFGIKPGSPEFTFWRSAMFYIPALVGGVFGLIGGYLTDKYGRRTILMVSILLYAVSAFLAGFSTSLWMLLFFRTTTFIGVCLEFVAAVAWLAELFPNPKQREAVLGWTQAFSSLGGLLVAIVNSYLIDQYGAKDAWRYTLMSGLIPAIPLIVIRPFLPESPVWKARKEANTLKRPSFGELFGPQYRKNTIIATLMMAAAYGVAFGAIQSITQIVPALPDVRAEVKDLPEAEARKTSQLVASEYTKIQEIGGMVGRGFLAIFSVFVLSRRGLIRIFAFPGLIVVPLVFYFFLTIPNTHFFDINLKAIYLGVFPITTVSLGCFLAGMFTVAQFSFWGNYLPQLFPTHLRGTGQSFAANVGGRMIGTSFAAISTVLASSLTVSTPGVPPPVASAAGLAMASACVAGFLYLVVVVLTFVMPEPESQELPD